MIQNPPSANKASSLAVLGVVKRNITYPIIMALLAVPIALQIVALVLYTVLIDRYGAVCC